MIAVSSGKELAQQIRQEIEARHPFIHHPFVHMLRDGKVTREQLVVWAKQLWAIPKYNIAVAGGKLSQCHPLPQDPFGLGAPYDDHVIKHFTEIVVDEVGKEILEYSPTAGHYQLYLRFAAALGIPREEMESIDIFLPRVIGFIHDWVGMARDLPLIESAIAMNFVNEIGFSKMGEMMYEALQKHYGLSAEDAEFFYVHGVEDQHHSSIGDYLIEHYATTPELQHRVWLAAQRGLGAYAPILDAVWEACVQPSPVVPV